MIKDIFVDFDGTLISNKLESNLFTYQSNNELSFDNSSKLWDWYNNYISEHSNMPLNTNLLNQLIKIKEAYSVNLHIWTNRSYDLESYTKKNLGDYTKIFSTFNFYNGFKSNSDIEGLILDNDSKYAINNNPFVKITF